jgi:RNA polymerase sigma factor (sigma-70 family)
MKSGAGIEGQGTPLPRVLGDHTGCSLSNVQACVTTCILRPRLAARTATRHGLGRIATPLPHEADDTALLDALRRGEAPARVTLLERFEPLIERLLAATLGFRHDFAQIVTDVFVRALERVHLVAEPAALPSFIGGLAVDAARDHMRRDRLRRWLRLLGIHVAPPQPRAATPVPPGARRPPAPAHDGPADCEILRGAYRVMDRLPDDDRIALALRFISQMTPAEVAAVCRVPVARIDRRLARATARFHVELQRDPVLGPRYALSR